MCKGSAACAVLAAVLFLGEHLTYVNCIGLVVLVLGVALFNYTKYRKVIMGQAVSAPAAHEKGSARAERREAHDSERALLVGGRRVNLGEDLLSGLTRHPAPQRIMCVRARSFLCCGQGAVKPMHSTFDS